MNPAVSHPLDGATGAFYVKGPVTGYGGIAASLKVLQVLDANPGRPRHRRTVGPTLGSCMLAVAYSQHVRESHGLLAVAYSQHVRNSHGQPGMVHDTLSAYMPRSLDNELFHSKPLRRFSPRPQTLKLAQRPLAVQILILKP